MARPLVALSDRPANQAQESVSTIIFSQDGPLGSIASEGAVLVPADAAAAGVTKPYCKPFDRVNTALILGC